MAIVNISNYQTTLVFLAVLLLPVVLCESPAPHTLTLERDFPTNDGVELSALNARDLARHRRMLAESSDGGGVIDFAVDGSSDPFRVGLYYTKIRLGSPPKEFYVAIDTGSDDQWVSCTSCNGCPTSTELKFKLKTFDPSSSATAYSVSCLDRRCDLKSPYSHSTCFTQTNQCSYTIKYAEGSSTSGYYVEDVLHLDRVVGSSVISTTTAPIVLGCSTSVSGILTTRRGAVDGIFGFGKQGLSVVTQLVSQEITPNAFSHCLKGGDDGGGILVFGHVMEPNLVYTPLLPLQPRYSVNMLSIAVNGQKFPMSRPVLSVIDSGTTLAYLEKEVYDPFVNAITQAVSKSERPFRSRGFQCYYISSSVSEKFPLVTLNFVRGASMILKPEEYLLRPKSVRGFTARCLGFRKTHSGNLTILGDLVLKDKIVVYDLDGQRIGWAEHDCSSSVNISTNSSSGMSESVNARQISGSSSKRDASVAVISVSITLFILNIMLFYSFPTL